MTSVSRHHDPDVEVEEQTLIGFANHCRQAGKDVRTEVITDLRIAGDMSAVFFGGEDAPWATPLTDSWNQYMQYREDEAQDIKDELDYLATAVKLAAMDYDLTDLANSDAIDSVNPDDLPTPR